MKKENVRHQLNLRDVLHELAQVDKPCRAKVLILDRTAGALASRDQVLVDALARGLAVAHTHVQAKLVRLRALAHNKLARLGVGKLLSRCCFITVWLVPWPLHPRSDFRQRRGC